MAHAAQVAFAPLRLRCRARRAPGYGRDDVGIAEGRGQGEKARESGGVVADTRGVDAGAVFFFDGFDEGACRRGRFRVEMCGEEDAVRQTLDGRRGRSKNAGVSPLRRQKRRLRSG